MLLAVGDPTLAFIPDVTVYSGAPLHIALDGFDAEGDALTYSVASTNPALTATVPQGNRSMRISVQDYGDMVFELFEDLTPRTAERVAELAQSEFYDGLTLHRVIPGVAIQGGDPLGNGSGSSGVVFDDEFHPNLQYTSSGILSMSKDVDDTNDEEFFISNAAARFLDFTCTAFGFLVDGNGVREQINAVATDAGGRPLTPVVMSSVTIFQDQENGVLRLSAPEGTSGQADVTVTVSDGQGGSAERTFHVTIQPDPNDAPPFLLPIDPVRTTADIPIAWTIPAHDVEGNPIVYTGIASPANADLQVEVDASTGSILVTPTNGIVGVHSLAVAVRAAGGSAWDNQAVPVYIAPKAPGGPQLLAAADTGASAEDRLTSRDNTPGKTLQFLVTRVLPGAEVSLYAEGDHLIGRATAAGETVTIETNGAFDLTDGPHSITAVQTLVGQEVNVGNLHTQVDLVSGASEPVEIVVDTVVPQFTSDALLEAGEEVPYSYHAETDATEGQVAYALVQSPAGMDVDPITGLVTWTPVAGQSGDQSVTLSATDLAGNVVEQAYQISVTALNQAPVIIVPLPQIAPPDGDLVISGIGVSDLDAAAAEIRVTLTVAHGVLTARTDVAGGLAVDGISGNATAALTLTGAPAAIHATLVSAAGLKYRGAAGYSGSDSLIITADDQGNSGTGGAKSATETLPITVAFTTLALAGTGVDDVLTILPGPGPGEWTVDLNGAPYLVAGPNASLSFNGRGGRDTVKFTGGGGADEATIWPDHVELRGSGYAFTAENIEETVYDGAGGTDTVTIWGTQGTDLCDMRPGAAEMSGDGVSIVVAAETIYARGRGGGDVVKFHDSPGDDLLEYFPVWARMSGEGYFNHVRGFKTMIADAEWGENGSDKVIFRGSNAGDFFRVTPVSARFLSGTGGVWHVARGFDTIIGYGRGGNLIDKLILHDTPAADTFTIKPLEATLVTPTYTVAAHGFGTKQIYRVNPDGPDDSMAMADSQWDDTLVGNPEAVTLSGSRPGYSNTAVGFPSVRAYSTGNGHDTAYLADFTGPDDPRAESDTFTANSLVVQLTGPGYNIRARLFDEVRAEAKGGRDIAKLKGNANPNVLTAAATEVSFAGTNLLGPFIYYARSFDEVETLAGAGQDRAVLAGAMLNTDTFGPPDGVPLASLPQALWLNDFEKVELDGVEEPSAEPVFAYWGVPSIAALGASPNSVTQGSNLTLSATGVADSDGTVAKVEFYRDVNENGVIEVGTDILLGSDTSAGSGWTWTGSTGSFPLGTNHFLARAQDNALLWSKAAAATATLLVAPKKAPTIGSLSDSPDPVIAPAAVTLTAGAVVDSDGSVTQVEFYRDSNGNGSLDTATDALLGTDTDGSDGWSFSAATGNFPTGKNRYFARAQDNDAMWSNVVTTVGTVTLLGLPDGELPQASSTPPDVFNSGGTRYEFDVRYTDNIAIDVSTLGNSDIRISCPTNGFTTLAKLDSFTPSTGGNSVTATYYFTPPGGSWDSIDNAFSYQVLMVASQVSDTSGHYVQSGLLGEFRVSVPAVMASLSLSAGSSGAVDESESSESAAVDAVLALWS